MENEEEHKEKQPESEEENPTMYYIIGGVVLVVVIAGVYFMRPKPQPVPAQTLGTEQTQVSQLVVLPTGGPITEFACDNLYYNPVVGFAKYFLSAQGGNTKGTRVDCDITVSVSGQITAQEKVASPLTEAPERGGKTFRCTSQVFELQPEVPTKVDFKIVDDEGDSINCSSTFLLPKP